MRNRRCPILNVIGSGGRKDWPVANGERENLVRRWRASLASSSRQPASARPYADGRAVLHAKVLQYLIARYEDQRCWNKHAARLSRVEQGTARRMGSRAAVNESLASIPAPLQPSRRDAGPALRRIHTANAASYREYGIALD